MGKKGGGLVGLGALKTLAKGNSLREIVGSWGNETKLIRFPHRTDLFTKKRGGFAPGKLQTQAEQTTPEKEPHCRGRSSAGNKKYQEWRETNFVLKH